MTIYSERTFGLRSMRDSLSLASISGVLLVMVFFNGLIFLPTKDTTYLQYVVFSRSSVSLMQRCVVLDLRISGQRRRRSTISSLAPVYLHRTLGSSVVFQKLPQRG